MTYPTNDEIRRASDGITGDGPVSEVTIRLCAIVLGNPGLRETVQRQMSLVRASVNDPIMLEGAIAAGIASGLNYGMRIADMRNALTQGGRLPDAGGKDSKTGSL